MRISKKQIYTLETFVLLWPLSVVAVPVAVTVAALTATVVLDQDDTATSEHKGQEYTSCMIPYYTLQYGSMSTWWRWPKPFVCPYRHSRGQVLIVFVVVTVFRLYVDMEIYNAIYKRQSPVRHVKVIIKI